MNRLCTYLLCLTCILDTVLMFLKDSHSTTALVLLHFRSDDVIPRKHPVGGDEPSEHALLYAAARHFR